MLLGKDIIPITYLGGTGGNFLCHFIVSAKRNIKDIVILSKHGNAHEFGFQDLEPFSFLRGQDFSDQPQIDWLLSRTPDASISKPYYTCAHIYDMNLINDNFEKSIRITYDLDDVSDITTVFYKKWAMDSFRPSYAFRWCRANPNYIHEKILFNQENFPKFSNMEKTMQNVLFVSWKELFKENTDDLIKKISTFTNINFDNFSKESLNYWRTKTQYCIEEPGVKI